MASEKTFLNFFLCQSKNNSDICSRKRKSLYASGFSGNSNTDTYKNTISNL